MLKFRETAIVLLLVFSGILLNAQENKTDALDSYFEQAIKDWNVPGMAVAIVHNNMIELEKGYGLSEVNTDKKVDKNTIFPIASITKSFTVAALAQLVSQGKVGWNDKVVDYLPYFRLYDSYVTQEMTIADLLCHRSGLKTFSGDLLWYGTNYSREEVIKKAVYLKPEYGFRTTFGYSNIMFIAAGEIVAKVSGMTWDEYIQKNIFDILKMESSSTSLNVLKNQSNKALPHNDVDGKVVAIDYLNWDNIGGAGAINSSVHDMTNWLLMWLGHGRVDNNIFFFENEYAEITSPHTFLKPNNAALWPSMHFKAYGLGLEMFDYHGKKVFGHSGGYDGVISYMCFVPEEKLGFVILTNKNSSLYFPLAYKILDTYLSDQDQDWSKTILKFVETNKKREKENQEKALSVKPKNADRILDLKSYVGIYSNEAYGNVEVKIKNKKLYVDMLPSPIFEGPLEHWAYNTFIVEMTKVPSLPKGKVHFTMNADGAIETMQIDIPNPDFDFTEFKFTRIEK